MHDYAVTLNYIINEASTTGNNVVESFAMQLDHLLHEEEVSPKFIEATLEFLESALGLSDNPELLNEVDYLYNRVDELEKELYEAEIRVCDCGY